MQHPRDLSCHGKWRLRGRPGNRQRCQHCGANRGSTQTCELQLKQSEEATVLNRLRSCLVALMPLVAAAPAAAQQPNPYAPRSVGVYAPWFQLPCLQPARGPL